MKKLVKFTLFTCFLFNLATVKAQVDTSTTQKLLQYIFKNIDKTQIPTGYLGEYGCPILPMKTFNGSLSDSNQIDMNLWRTLYFQLQTAYVGNGSNSLPAITTVNSSIASTGNNPVTIPVIIGQYNTVSSNAFSSNLLSYKSSVNQIFDVSGRSQTPYNINNLFAACPNNNTTATGSATFVCNSNLIYNNTGKTISNLKIDFGDGGGNRSIALNTNYTINYSSAGTKRWIIQVTLSDNTILQCYNQYYVLQAYSGTTSRGVTTFSYPNYYPPSRTMQYWFSPTGTDAGGNITVCYSAKSPTNTLRKPLIVIEGYDVNSVASGLQPNPYSYVDFINAINYPIASYNFNSQLDDVAGYDIVFLTFNNGTDDITRNAALVQRVIQWVNANKVADNRFGNIMQQNVVMGLSMGGLCARYALADMTKRSIPTNTRLLITHDSPHQGANVPLGLQYFIRMLGGVQLFGTTITDIFPQYNDALNLFNAPATQQLLLYRSTSSNTYTNNTFLNSTYRNMVTFGATDPQPSYRFIATSLGSECGHALYAPYKTFLNAGAGIGAGITANFLFFRVPIVTYNLGFQAEAYSLPATGSIAKLARIYSINQLQLFGFINIVKQLYNNTAYSDGTNLPVDGVPGSTSPLLDVPALQQLSNISTFPPLSLNLQFPIYSFVGGYFNAYAYNAGFSYNFTFVPAASALDISPFNTSAFSQQYVNGTNQNYPSKSDTYIAQETINSTNSSNATNNEHIRFTARNSQWLFNEMENLNNNLNCSSECSNPYYISGNDPICSSSIFTIPGLQRGASVAWSASPSGIVSLQPNGNSVTLTNTRVSGTVTLTATINNACSSTPITTSTTISVGSPAPTYIDYSIDPLVSCNEVRVTCNYTAGNTYTWSYFKQPYNGNNLVQFPNSSATRKLTLTQGSGTYNIGVTATNICGVSNITFISVPINCSSGSGGKLVVNPNPAKGSLNISLTSADATSTIALATTSATENFKPSQSPTSKGKTIISLFNFTTNTLVKQWTQNEINSKSYNLSIVGLQKGVYVLQVDRDNETATTKVIIE